MDFLKDITIPQAPDHISLLHVMLALVLSILLPFLALQLGSLLLSLYHRGRKGGDATMSQRYTNDVFNLAVVNRSVLIVLSIVPMLAVVMIYAQLLQPAQTIVMDVLILSFIFCVLSAGVVAWKKTTLLSHPSNQTTGLDVLGVILLTLTSLFLFAAMTLASHPDLWNQARSLLDALAIVQVWIHTTIFLASAVMIASGAMLFFGLSWYGGRFGDEPQYEDYIRRESIPPALLSLLSLPFLIVLLVLFSSTRSYNFMAFVAASLTIVALFVAGQSLYFSWIRKSRQPNTIAFFAVLTFFACLSMHESLVLSTATQKEAVALAVAYQKAEILDKESLGIGIVKVSGKEIFDGRCSACHRFDTKLVGPPYQETLPKYQGKRGELVAYILNPVKKNPGYPPMPNQGLKPAEAEAVADFLLETLKTTKK